VAAGERAAAGRAARFTALADFAFFTGRAFAFAGALRAGRYCFVCTEIFRMSFSSTVTPMPGPEGTSIVPSGRTVNGSPMISVSK